MTHANPLAAAILITWKRNAAYGLRLVEDLAPTQLVAQPIPALPGRAPNVLNHPAWILSHLNLYAGIAVDMALGTAFEDPAEHRHGQKSEPLADSNVYESKDVLLTAWTRLHTDGEFALTAATPEYTSRPNRLERWRTLHPTVGDMLVTLMVKHESGHLGQLSAWRRAMGMPRVAM